MAFDDTKFSRISGGVASDNAVTLYSYDFATDNLATVKGSGYFDSASALRAGDIVYVEASDGGDVIRVSSLTPTVTTDYNTSSVADGSITEAKLAANAVTEAKMDAATAAKLLSTGSVDTDELAANAVTEGKLATAVANKLLGTDSVNITHIADNAVGPDQLGNNSVDTDALQNSSVTLVKLAAAVTAKLPRNTQIYTTTGGSTSENISIAGVLSTDVVEVTPHTVGSTPVQFDRAIAGAGQVTLHFSADPSTDHKYNVAVYPAS